MYFEHRPGGNSQERGASDWLGRITKGSGVERDDDRRRARELETTLTLMKKEVAVSISWFCINRVIIRQRRDNLLPCTA